MTDTIVAIFLNIPPNNQSDAAQNRIIAHDFRMKKKQQNKNQSQYDTLPSLACNESELGV